MSVKNIVVRNCDRCGHTIGSGTIRMEIGWFKFMRSGSGSKLTTPPDRTWDNLDRDLCEDCTIEFFQWWGELNGS